MTLPAQQGAVFFDLDGTLTNPRVGILGAMRHALDKFEITGEDDETLISFVGAPLFLFFRNHYSMSDELARLAMDHYRDYYSEKGLYENELYDGIPELLGQLRDGGRTLSVATLKPLVFAKRVLDHFGLSIFFDHVSGPDLKPEGLTKTDIVAMALAKVEGVPRNKIIMVGDRDHDIIGARENGIASVGVSYGFGSIEELRAARPDAIAGSVAELQRILIKTD
jgi:phosphoglycolate phosphatase